MDSPTPTAPNSGATPAPAPTERWNRLALTSFVLALLPVLAAALAILVNALFPDLMNHELIPGFPLVLVILTADYVGGHLIFLGALVSGALGLSQARRYPPGHAWRGFGIAGLVLASAGLLALVCLDIVVAYVSSTCRSSTGC